jgi:hypothetical protein
MKPDESLKVNKEPSRIVIDLPKEAPDPVASVIKLKLSEEPVTLPIASYGKSITASSEQVDHPAAHALDGTGHHFWEAADTTGESYLEIDMGSPTWIQAVGLDEPDRWPRLRQNINMKVETDEGWKEVISAKTVGHGLVRKFKPVQVHRVRLSVNRAAGPPAIAEWQLYAPE